MKIDVTQFHQTFFEESYEGLDAMEAALLGLSPDAADGETVNTIFRAAHSIKGGAGTFGFMEISEFTHVVETLLDQVRSGEREPDQALIELMLQSVDSIRAMLDQARAGEQVEIDIALQGQLEAMLTAAPEGASTPDAAPAPVEDAGLQHWTIRFVPHLDMMTSGNDPLRIIRELARMGSLETTVSTAELPDLKDINPEGCYLSWEMALATEHGREAVEDVFAWVEDECDLDIQPAAGAVVPAAESVPETPAPEVPEPEAPESAEPTAPDVVAASEPAATPEPAPPPPADPTPAAKPAAAEAAPARSKAAPASRSTPESSSVRVSVEKIDTLINLVGELVITQAMLQQQAADLDPVEYESLISGLNELDQNTRHLQEAVMSTRMLPVDFVFSRFPRVVRDTASKLGKNVRLETSGEGTELDKGVIEKITDPLNHIVRNAVDHGVESPEERAAAGKPEQATVRLAAWHQGGHIMIQVSDDGAGLSREKILDKARKAGMELPDSISDSDVWQLIFSPGLSTAEKVTDLSGRGVGMDVVKKNIQSLGGMVEVQSAPGQGTTVTIRLPLTLAILDGMSVAVGDEIYILPLSSVVESLQPTTDSIKYLAGEPRMIRVRGEFVHLVSLGEFFGLKSKVTRIEDGIAVIVEAEGKNIALLVDELVGQQQVVIKSLEKNYRRVSGVSGATILGDGRVALIVDTGEVMRHSQSSSAAA